MRILVEVGCESKVGDLRSADQVGDEPQRYKEDITPALQGGYYPDGSRLIQPIQREWDFTPTLREQIFRNPVAREFDLSPVAWGEEFYFVAG